MEQNRYLINVMETNSHSKNCASVKKLVNKVALILCCVFLLYSCATQKKYSAMMDTWKGEPISEIILHQGWGPATKTTPDGQGGTVYTWIEGVCTSHFYVNSDGIIYFWRWDGNCRHY